MLVLRVLPVSQPHDYTRPSSAVQTHPHTLVLLDPILLSGIHHRECALLHRSQNTSQLQELTILRRPVLLDPFVTSFAEW